MRSSVIIPVYNAEKYLRQACESALTQPETGEVILVEDASPDHALAVCQALATEDARVKVLRHPDGDNRGAGASRNLGIRNARHELIAFLDADDYFLPDRFSRACELLASDPSLDGVYEAMVPEFEDESARERWREAHDIDVSNRPERVEPDDLFEALVCRGQGWFKTGGIVVRKSLFEKTGLFDEHLGVAQDTAMWTKMSEVGRLARGREDRPVVVRRVHAGNRSHRHTRECRRSLHLMWQTVFVWAMRKTLSVSKRSALLERYLESTEHYRFNFRFWRVRKLCGLLRLPLVALRFPAALKLPGFWEYAKDCVRQVMGVGLRAES